MSAPAAALREIASAARALHHRLLVTTQRRFEKLHGRVGGPGELLQLALHDPLFAWLRPLSQRVALLDELLAAGDVAREDLERAREEVADLIERDAEFRGPYLVYLQTEPDVVIAHAALLELIRRGGARPSTAERAP